MCAHERVCTGGMSVCVCMHVRVCVCVSYYVCACVCEDQMTLFD